MPGMDGVELLRKIRAREADDGASYVYAILLTSRSEMSDLVEGMSSGADDFVSKPFDKDELRVRILAAQRIVELEQALSEQNRELAVANGILHEANRRMKESLAAAAKVQQSCLPSSAPSDSSARFGWLYEPCDELGGDTLNIVRLDSDMFGVFIADVSGHGVPAALLSVHLSLTLTDGSGPGSILRRSSDGGPGLEATPPVEVLAELNHRFTLDEEVQQYFTAMYGVLDLRTREFHYASAGHPGPLLISNGKGRRHRARPPAIGFLPEPTFTKQSLQCSAGDRLYFYTDGIFETPNPQDEEFGEERLQETLEEAAGTPLQQSLEQVRDAARAWSGRRPFIDDVSLIGLEVR
jgi:sigma-B regulation protein RsbU (phosphoserine phosphatase)